MARRCNERGRMHRNLISPPCKPAISITGQPKNTNYYWFIITLQHGKSNDAFSLACTCAAVLRNATVKFFETLRLAAPSAQMASRYKSNQLDLLWGSADFCRSSRRSNVDVFLQFNLKFFETFLTVTVIKVVEKTILKKITYNYVLLL